MADFEALARLHRKRAEQLRANADATRRPETCYLYLRLAEREEALAEQMERLWKTESLQQRRAPRDPDGK